MTATTTLKPYRKENITTIQVTKELKQLLSSVASKEETYNAVIEKLVNNFLESNPELKKKIVTVTIPAEVKQVKQAAIVIAKYDRVQNTYTDRILNDHNVPSGPNITFEISYNKSISKEDPYFSLDLKLEKVIFGSEVYSIKEYFGVFQKDMVYSKDFMYYYFKAVLAILFIEFKTSNIFFKHFNDYFEIVRWRTFIKTSRLSYEILSYDIESALYDYSSKTEDAGSADEVKESISTKFKALIEHGKQSSA